MINANLRDYNYFTFGAKNEYGQAELTEEVQGTINAAIYTLSTTIGNTVKYKDATYILLTKDNSINDTFVIQYGEEKLKVLYIIPSGRFTQAFLSEM